MPTSAAAVVAAVAAAADEGDVFCRTKTFLIIFDLGVLVLTQIEATESHSGD